MADTVMLAAPELQRQAPRLLKLWEQASEAGPQQLEDLLLAFEADTSAEAEDASKAISAAALPQGLGERNLRLLAMRARLLGPQLDLLADCPHCASPVEFSLDCQALLQSLKPSHQPAPAEPQALELDGYRLRFRRPVIDDLRACARQLAHASNHDSAQFARLLLQRCILDCEPPSKAVRLDPLPETLCQALAERLEQLDPGANISLSLHCPDCEQDWSAPLSPAPLLWQELRGQAEQLLSEVSQLAQAYGWSEAQVLDLSPRRRHAYLRLCEGAHL